MELGVGAAGVARAIVRIIGADADEAAGTVPPEVATGCGAGDVTADAGAEAASGGGGHPNAGAAEVAGVAGAAGAAAAAVSSGADVGPCGAGGVGAGGDGCSCGGGLSWDGALGALVGAARARAFDDGRAAAVAAMPAFASRAAAGARVASPGSAAFAGAAAHGVCGAVVCVESLDPRGLEQMALQARLIQLGEARNRLEGEFLRVVGEHARRWSPQSTAYVMRDQLRVSSSQARSDARLGHDLVEHGLEDTRDALCAGEITSGHARVIAKAAPKEHQKDEDSLLELARAYAADTCGKHTQAYHDYRTEAAARAEKQAKEERQRRADAELAAQRAERAAGLRRLGDGMYSFYGKFDYVTGRLISKRFHAAMAAQRQAPDREDRTWSQRAADAMAGLLTGDSPQTSLVLVADYDATAGRLGNPRLDDGTAISAELLAELAVNAKVLPAIFDARWANLAFGASRRNATDTQKLVLALRDGGCIGCDAPPEATHAHHIEFWSDGGPTDIANLASLCHPCHNLVHKDNFTVHSGADGHPELRPPDHFRVPPQTNPQVNPILRN